MGERDAVKYPCGGNGFGGIIQKVAAGAFSPDKLFIVLLISVLPGTGRQIQGRKDGRY